MRKRPKTDMKKDGCKLKINKEERSTLKQKERDYLK